MNSIIYKTDEGHRKGCHPVVRVREKWDGRRKKVIQLEDTLFLIDEPGAWFDDKWNCHVDGTDYPMNSRENAIIWGLYVHGILDFEEEQERKDLRKLIKK